MQNGTSVPLSFVILWGADIAAVFAAVRLPDPREV